MVSKNSKTVKGTRASKTSKSKPSQNRTAKALDLKKAPKLAISPDGILSSAGHGAGGQTPEIVREELITSLNGLSDSVLDLTAKQRAGRGQKRKHLDERLRSLYRRAMIIEKQLLELEANRFYRVCIFGSARIKPDSPQYIQVEHLAQMLASEGIDILTGGGPGLMEAANKGAKAGQGKKSFRSLSFGLSIELDFEPVPNSHLDVKRHHHKFSSRLDDFMRLSQAVIATPGGIGTVLELFFAWQLIQVKHLEPRPIVLLDRSYWEGIIDWMKNIPLARGLVSAKDFDCIKIVDTPEEVFELIKEDHRAFRAKRMNAADISVVPK